MAAINFPNGPSVGDKHPVTPVAGLPQYTWDGEKWTTIGSQVTNATPSATVPLMDATPGLPGTVAEYSRGNHVHPTDTSRAALTYVDANMVGYAAQTTTANQKAQARANIAVTKRNYIINGGMMISQENGATAGTAAGYYPVDAWYPGSSITGWSVAQVASVTPGGSTSRLRVTVTTADAAVAAGDMLYLVHRIEGLRVADLLFGSATAKTITMQFGVKAPAGTYCVTLLNAASNRSYVSEYVISAGEANTDVVKSVVIPGDITGTWSKDNGVGFDIRFGLMAGTTFQQAAGSWGTTNAIGTANQFNFMSVTTATDPNRVFELFDVSLTEGSVAPPFQLPDYASEVLLCKRYWELIGPMVHMWSGNTTTGQNYYKGTSFSVVKRATPTLTGVSIGASGFANTLGSLQADTGVTGCGFWEMRVASITGSACYFQATVTANARL